MLTKLKQEFVKWGLIINFDKTEYLCVGEVEWTYKIGRNTYKKSSNNFKQLDINTKGTQEEEIKNPNGKNTTWVSVKQ